MTVTINGSTGIQTPAESVTGNETVGGTLVVTGATALNGGATVSGTSVVAVAPGANGNLLTSNGTAWTSAVPPTVVTSIVAGTNITVSGPTGAVTVSATVPAQASTWTNVTGSRALGTTYTNSTGKTITVIVSMGYPGSTGSYAVYVGAVNIASGAGNANYNSAYYKLTDTVTFVVPNGATYLVSVSGMSLNIWSEFS